MKRIIITVFVVGALLVLGVVGAGAGAVMAEDADSDVGQRIARQFRSVDTKLENAVSEASITQEQKDAILAKRAEFRAQCQELRDISPEERREAKREFSEQMRAWAEENDIDPGLMPMNRQSRGHEGQRDGRNR